MLRDPNHMPTLTQLAEQAFSGNRAACVSFLRTFLETELVIPDREQTEKLSFSVEASSPFFPFFAFESEGETFVPVFELEEQVASWTGTPLSSRRYSGRQLFTLMPASWWVVFNPGSEVEKVFSPWEIALLRTGSEEAIAEVVTELFDSPSEEFLDARTVEPGEHPQLFEAFSQFCRTTHSVKEGWVLEIAPATEENPAAKEVIIGVMISPGVDAATSATHTAALRLNLEQRLGPFLIGWGTLRTAVIAEGEQSVIGSLLSSHAPLYRRPTP